MDLDQAFNSALQITNDSSVDQFQPFDSLPDEVLLLLLDPLTPFQRCLILSICRKWNQVILGHKPWWQYLDIPNQFPFWTTLSILQTFNSRSNFTLRHVIIRPLITSSEEVDEVFVELEKSSGHIKLLFLNQSRSMLKTRRAANRILPKLNTLFLAHTRQAKRRLETMWHEKAKVSVNDEEEGLQFLQVTELGKLGTDDLEWFSKLKHLGIDRTDSVTDLRAILEVSKKTLVRLRLDFWRFDRNLEEPDLVHADGFSKIRLPELETFFPPKSEASGAVLSSLIDVGGQQTVVLLGYVHSLLHFDFPSLEEAYIRMYERNDLGELGLDEEEAKMKTFLFFEGNPSISCLGLDRFARLQDGESIHLDFILHSLSTKRNGRNFDESKRESQSFLLPKLRWLNIDTPYALDKKLLKQLWETRKVIQEDIKIQGYIEDFGFCIDRSGGENWLDETESCECSGSRSSLSSGLKKGSS